jgi:hypothetical protein
MHVPPPREPERPQPATDAPGAGLSWKQFVEQLQRERVVGLGLDTRKRAVWRIAPMPGPASVILVQLYHLQPASFFTN